MKQYFSFEGVATRSEYWLVLILTTIVVVVGAMVSFSMMLDPSATLMPLGIALLFVILGIGVWVELAVSWKRVRDIGTHPAFSLFVFAPYIGVIVAIVIGIIPTGEMKKS